MVESRSQTGVTVATGHELRVWPNVGADEPQRMTIFLCAATGKENPRTIDLLGQLVQNFAQTFGRCETQIRWRQFSLIEDARRPTGSTHLGCNFHQRPGGFCATAFNSENSLTRFHNSLCLAALAEFGKLNASLIRAFKIGFGLSEHAEKVRLSRINWQRVEDNAFHFAQILRVRIMQHVFERKASRGARFAAAR